MSAIAWAAFAASIGVVAWPARPSAVLGRRRPSRSLAIRLAHSDPEAECLEVLDALVTVLRAGSATAPALVSVLTGVCERPGETSSGWRMLRDVAAQDGDVVSAWRELATRWRSDSFADVAAAWHLSSRRGCPLADALDSAAQSVRARRAHRAAVDTARAGAKASTGVLMGLPVLGVLLGMTLGVDMIGRYRGLPGLLTFWPGLGLISPDRCGSAD